MAKLYDNPKPDQILFSYVEKGVHIGYGGLVHINWIDNNAEISFIMDTKLEIEHFKRALKQSFTEDNVRSVRPGFGLHPKYLPEVLGKTAARDLEMGERFSLNMVR